MNPEKCIFCRIARGEISCKKIYEDESSLAFLDINPAALGHALVIPKKHFENIFDIDSHSLEKLAHAVQKVAKNMRAQLGADVMILQNNGRHSGQIVDHMHYHVIPRREADGIHISQQRIQLKDDELEQIRKKLMMESKPPADNFPRW